MNPFALCLTRDASGQLCFGIRDRASHELLLVCRWTKRQWRCSTYRAASALIEEKP